MKILLVGGTGTISSAVTDLLSERGQDQVYVLNRGNRSCCLPSGVTQITADAYDREDLASALDGMSFDVVAYFIGFEASQVRTACEVLDGRIGQFIFISSASAYQKPPRGCVITEDTPLENPYWEYSRKKIEGEKYLMGLYREKGFPVTIVRPSHTYCERGIPVGMHGNVGKWQVIQRIIDGKPVIVHGDGLTTWTMTDSRDFAKAFVGLMGNPAAIGQAFHITSDESITWDQIYREIGECLSEVLGRDVGLKLCHVSSEMIIREGRKYGYDMEGNLLGDKANSVLFDNSRIKAAVPGFKAVISHREGTLRSVRYLLSHPELQVKDPEFDAFCDHLAGL